MLYKGGLQLCIGLESLGPPKTISLDPPLDSYDQKALAEVLIT